jgi:hypothetical protein
MLIIVSDSSVRTFLLFINIFVLLFVIWWPPMGSVIQPFGSQITGRADPLLWGVTLPQFEARLSRD